MLNKLNERKDAKYRTVTGIMSETNLSRSSVIAIAQEAGAIIRFGKRGVRINAEAFFSWLTKGANMDA